ncbi:hypothetical protein J5N97_017171 [Dioscorea zingiberensis]|uniref:Uncharacterized protein n=1 Tax=Dioscorea zingiberensis TaxID=325984 RepID=A0A9D5CKX8_9LILI|nr:hypothetical protein J5N97_017171 [Dioscorea zingiberensis]
MSRLPPPRSFTAAFHRTPCVLAHKHRIAGARSPSAALRGCDIYSMAILLSYSSPSGFQEVSRIIRGVARCHNRGATRCHGCSEIVGMEICDLTMELSDLGQGIAQGVRRSTQVVCIAEDRLRRFSMLAPTVSMQTQATSSINVETPMVAKTAKNLREGIAKSRSVFGVLVSIAKLSRWVLNFSAQRRKKQQSI